ncbi:hypothetical protein PIB30_094656 [Stylosanthes scabra]|uniref:Uncharacterized protein n=1 Tax=Stylosanthes scabra TaxID=79078 RepID=A0ABU6YT74_9FABA|nr:hypothetical protein [Stylosanthes scabra]
MNTVETLPRRLYPCASSLIVSPLSFIIQPWFLSVVVSVASGLHHPGSCSSVPLVGLRFYAFTASRPILVSFTACLSPPRLSALCCSQASTYPCPPSPTSFSALPTTPTAPLAAHPFDLQHQCVSVPVLARQPPLHRTSSFSTCICHDRRFISFSNASISLCRPYLWFLPNLYKITPDLPLLWHVVVAFCCLWDLVVVGHVALDIVESKILLCRPYLWFSHLSKTRL